jgi:hypothetical protein
MYAYPSIPGASKAPREPCLAFVKYDGSNLRFEWSKAKGWHKYGTRERLFDQTDSIFGPAIPVFLAKYGDSLARVFTDTKAFRGFDRFTVFGEFYGPNSFAGIHKPGDDFTVTVFDVCVKGTLLAPQQFLEHFGHLPVAEVVYEGNLNQSFIDRVRASVVGDGDLSLDEGVICKGKGRSPWMCKVKTLSYYERLRAGFPDSFASKWE